MIDATIVVLLPGASATEKSLAALAASAVLVKRGARPADAAMAFAAVERANADGTIDEMPMERREQAAAWKRARHEAYRTILQSRGGGEVPDPPPEDFEMRVVYLDR